MQDVLHELLRDALGTGEILSLHGPRPLHRGLRQLRGGPQRVVSLGRNLQASSPQTPLPRRTAGIPSPSRLLRLADALTTPILRQPRAFRRGKTLPTAYSSSEDSPTGRTRYWT